MNSAGTSKAAEPVDLTSVKDKDSFAKSLWKNEH